jgi:hypothetical protein
MRVPFLTLELHLKRLLQSVLMVGGITALVWCFCYSVRSFFRDEPLHLTLLMFLLLKTLPVLLPFLSAVATQLCVIRMHKKKEWPLLELMGLRTWSRHLYFMPVIMLLCWTSYLLEVPFASALNEKSQQLYLKQQLAEVRPDRPLIQGDWNIFRLASGNLLLQGQKQWVMTTSVGLHPERMDALHLRDGIHWSESEQGVRRKLSFESFEFPLGVQSRSPTPKTSSFSKKSTFAQASRVFTLPFALYFLGYQLGLLHQHSGFRRSASLTFICLFIIYYPSTILGKDVTGERASEWLWMFLPHAGCLVMAKALSYTNYFSKGTR